MGRDIAMIRWLALLVFMISVPSWAATYYIAASGSDSNNGTAKGTPWLHAPGMPACSNTCGGKTPAAGDSFIFRGGDTWHFGNSSAAPYVGGTCPNPTTNFTTCWEIGNSGTSGNIIYWGVDQTWFVGGAWARPIFTGDNATSSSSVVSCTYDFKRTKLVSIDADYVTLDNVEFTGLCWSGNQSTANEDICCAGYMNFNSSAPSSSAGHSTVSNIYVHGWTHRQQGCSLTGGEPTGDCDGAYGISGANGAGNINANNRITGLVCDGTDTDEQSFDCTLWDVVFQLDSSYLGYAVQGAIAGNCHLWYNDIFEHINFSFDGISHTNTFECQSEYPGANYFHDLVFRNSSSGSLMWVCPNAADWYWNIVSYSNGTQPWDIDASCGGSGGSGIYDSVFADEGSPGATGSYIATNLLLINSGLLGTPTQTSVISMTDAQATAAGFTSGGSYAYQPQSANCNGHSSPTCPVGNGTNLTSSWPGGFTTNDSTYACTYNTSNHTMTCPARSSLSRPSAGAWDVGAYQFTSLISGSSRVGGVWVGVLQ